MRLDTSRRTENDTDVYVPRAKDDATHVEVAFYGGGIENESGGAIWVSFTPAEARWLSNRLLDGAQEVEDNLPHGNC